MEIVDLLTIADTLTNKQRQVFEYMVEHPEESCFITVRDLADKTDVTPVSVLRMSKALGFDSFVYLRGAFRDQIQRQNSRNKLAADPSILDVTNDIAPSLSERILAYEKYCVDDFFENISGESIMQAADTIINAREVMLLGHTTSKIIADYLAVRLNSVWIKATPIQVAEGVYAKSLLSHLQKEDLLIIISFRPYYSPLYNITRYAEECGAKIITFSYDDKSPAISRTGQTFICGNPAPGFRFRAQAPAVILMDLISFAVAEKINIAKKITSADENALKQLLISEEL